MVKKTFTLILLSYIIFFILIPPFQVNDEPDHYRYVFSLSNLKIPFLPKKTDSKIPPSFINEMTQIYDLEKVNTSPYFLLDFQKIKQFTAKKQILSSENIKTIQAYHPPLYYFFASLFFHLGQALKTDLITQFYIVRLASGIFYFLSVFAAYKILKMFLKENSTVNNLLVFFSINPIVLKMAVGINPEIAGLFFSLLFLYFLLLSVNQKKLLKTKTVFQLAILGAISTLAKFSGIFTGLTFLIISFFQKKQPRKFLMIFLFFLSFIILLLPWFALNIARYKTPLPTVFSTICQTKLPIYNLFQAIPQAVLEFRHSIYHFSGFLGWGEPYPFKWFFFGYAFFFTIFLIIGLIQILLKNYFLNKVLVIYTSSLLIFLFSLSLSYKLTRLDCDIQGRYLLPIFLPMTFIIFKGIMFIFKTKSEKISYLMALFAIFHFLFILFFVLIPKYYV